MIGFVSVRTSALLLAMAGLAMAKPQAPGLFCSVYPGAAVCRARTAPCTTCHTSPPTFNAYGEAVASKLPEGNFDTVLAQALAAVEPLDSDGDGVSNAVEIAAGTAPGNPLSVFRLAPGAKPRRRDPAFTLKRLSAAFCGVSASYDELRQLSAASDPSAVIHKKLDECLDSHYWKFVALARMADEKVRPVAMMGHCQNQFTDFEKDYNLFVYTMTAGRDVREMITARYHVRRDNNVLSVIDESSGPPSPPSTRAGIPCRFPPGAAMLSGAGGGIQATPPPYRAGMWTTQHSMVMGTQGTLMPRVTAAAAYRGFLGYELSQYEGVHAILREPRDIDKKGVRASACQNCHAALDPLAYAFAYYWGAPGNGKNFGEYDPERPTVFREAESDIVQEWALSEPQPAILGQTVAKNSTLTSTSSLVELARIAANSEPFASNIVRLIFVHATGGPPEPGDWDEFSALVENLRRENYSVNAMIHRLVDTLAFGGIQ